MSTDKLVDVPKIGDVLTEEYIDINYPKVKENSVRLVDTGNTDNKGNKIYKINLK